MSFGLHAQRTFSQIHIVLLMKIVKGLLVRFISLVVVPFSLLQPIFLDCVRCVYYQHAVVHCGVVKIVKMNVFPIPKTFNKHARILLNALLSSCFLILHYSCFEYP